MDRKKLERELKGVEGWIEQGEYWRAISMLRAMRHNYCGKPRFVFRETRLGRFVSKAFAEKHPDTTTKERL